MCDEPLEGVPGYRNGSSIYVLMSDNTFRPLLLAGSNSESYRNQQTPNVALQNGEQAVPKSLDRFKWPADMVNEAEAHARVTRGVKSIKKEVEELSSYIAESIPEGDADESYLRIVLTFLQDRHTPDALRRLDRFLKRKPPRQLFVKLAIAHLISSTLVEVVFDPLFPGLLTRDAGLIMDIYDRLNLHGRRTSYAMIITPSNKAL